MPLRLVVWVFGCVLLVGVMLTWTFLAMRAVVAVGGSCATGGPFEIATPCPDGAWLIAPAIPIMIIAALSGSGAGSEVGAPNLVVPLWGLLFGSLSWTFLERALFSGDFEVVPLLCGLMLVAFALPALWSVRELFRRDAWRSQEPGRQSLWWWTACYLGLFSVSATIGVLTYSLIG